MPTKCVLELRIPFEVKDEDTAREVTRQVIQCVADMIADGKPEKIEGALMLNMPRLPE